MSTGLRDSAHVDQDDDRSAIAVVGMACRFPGAEDYEQFWRNLAAARSSISEVPADRWPIAGFYDADVEAPGRSVSKWGGWLRDVDRFDNALFGISPREAAAMDPQQRLLLEEAWRCIEDAAIDQRELASKRTSTYVGVMAVDFVQNAGAAAPDAYGCSGSYDCMLANRLSYVFGLRGPSQTINTACSSSLVALHDARTSLLAGDSDFALVAAVSLNLNPWKYISFSKARMLSPDGRCKTFDQDANGYVPGEGIAVVLLQRLDQARAAGNRIHGVIRGSAVNHGGRSATLTAPRVEAQRDVIERAWADARIAAPTLSYIEAHGTGTSLGDPIEIEALTQAFRAQTAARQFCAIGSVKTNIGHLEAAAGLAGLIKVLLMMKHRALPPTLNLSTVNPLIAFEQSALRPALALAPWNPPADAARRAGISSFGFGGVNAHVVVEEHIDEPVKDDLVVAANGGRVPFVISAKSAEALEALVQSWRRFAASDEFNVQQLHDMCRTLMTGRRQLPHRFGALVRDPRELARVLEGAGSRTSGTAPRDVVLRIGDGPVDLSAFDALCDADAAVRDYAAECGGADGPGRAFVPLYALSRRLIDLGLRPQVVGGEGVGHLVALTVAGSLTARDAVAALASGDPEPAHALRRPALAIYDATASRIVQPIAFDGEYLRTLRDELAISPDEAAFYLGKAKALAANQFTFRKFLDEWNQALKTRGGGDVYAWLAAETPDGEGGDAPSRLAAVVAISCFRRLSVKWQLSEPHPLHSPALNELVDLLSDGVITIPEAIDLLRNHDLAAAAAAMNGRMSAVDLRKPYTLLRRFSASADSWSTVTTGGGALPARILPGSLTIDIGRLANDAERPSAVLDVTRDLSDGLAAVALEMWLQNVDVNWQRYRSGPSRRHADLPLYPFHRRSFPAGPCVMASADATPVASAPAVDTPTASAAAAVDAPAASPAPATVNRPVAEARTTTLRMGDAIVADHVITGWPIVPGALMIDLALTAARAATNRPVSSLSSIVIHHPGVVRDALEIRIDVDALQNRVSMTADRLLCSAQFDSAAGDASATDVTAMAPPLGMPMDVAALYRTFDASGYRYGDTLRVIRRATRSDATVWFDLEARAEAVPDAGTLSPNLLDGVFQAVLAARQVWAPEGELCEPGYLFVPHRIGRLRLGGALRGACRAIVHRADLVERRGTLRCRVTVYDDSGAAALVLDDLVLAKVPATFLGMPAQPACEAGPEVVSFRQPIWLRADNEAATAPLPTQAIVVSRAGVGATVAESLRALGVRVWRVEIGDATVDVGDGSFRISASDDLAFRRLFRAIGAELKTEAARPGPLALYYFAPVDAASADADDLQRRILEPLLSVGKALPAMRSAADVCVTVVTTGCRAVVEGDAAQGYAQAGSAALAATIAIENKGVTFKAIDVDAAATADRGFARRLLQETGLAAPFDQVAFRGAGRFALHYAPAQLDSGSPLRRAGVYLVTGGAGGVGLRLTEFLLAKYQAKVALIGRSPLAEATRQRLTALEAGGGRVTYLQADVRDSEHLRLIIQQVESADGALNGVIHAAGVTEDRLLVNKTWESFSRVIAPKLSGALALDAATRHLSLDFFALFSSVVSVVGNVGQGDYAAANALLDAFAHHRSRRAAPGRTVSFNWTLWADSGMGANDKAVAQLARAGIHALPPTAAVRAFADGLGSARAQLVVTHSSDSTRLQQAACPSVDGPQARVTGAAADSASTNAAMAAYVRDAVAQALGCAVTDLDDDTDFSDYGVDSIAIMTIARALEATLGVESVDHSAILDHPTVRALARHLSALTPAVLAAAAEQQPQPAVASDATTRLQHDLARMVADALSASVDDLDYDTDIAEYGADSMAIMAIVAALEPIYGDRIHHSLVLEHPTIRGLAACLASYAPAPSAAADAPLATTTQKPAVPPAPVLRVQDAGPGAIAVVALSGRFPKSPTIEAFWDNLVNGRDLIAPVPLDRGGFVSRGAGTRPPFVERGGFLTDIDLFDAAFFRIKEADAAGIDPQQRLFLEVTQELFDRAGYAPAQIAGTRTGIFVGGHESNYGRTLEGRRKYEGRHGVVNVIANMIAGRTADFYDVRGPAEMVYTACSSSLVAVHHACRAIAAGDCEMAIAGGIELLLDDEWFVGFADAKVLSPDGCCHVFDKRANGFVLGEAVGAVLLKRLDLALRDGDVIRGVVRASAVNNDGATMGLTTPNVEGQKAVIRAALDRGSIDPGIVGYYEAHGTGTALGDPIEIKAATQVFRERTQERGYCGAGSVKSNMGHALAAAGIASFIKVMLAIEQQTIPPTLHCDTPHPRFEFDSSPFYPATRTVRWEPRAGRRTACISSFGFGGTNAHVVVQDFDSAAAGYQPTRAPRPATRFNRKRYWLTDAPVSREDQLREVFRRVAAGELSPRAASERLAVVGAAQHP
jgi:acyl transferase domain-containing protein/acyl carrier protein